MKKSITARLSIVTPETTVIVVPPIDAFSIGAQCMIASMVKTGGNMPPACTGLGYEFITDQAGRKIVRVTADVDMQIAQLA
ncbi:MAG: hypothetical protein JWM39_717 [Parcubacteria group bacterium]|nr:hypothetical protein [Parcubacteria group bacterium]